MTPPPLIERVDERGVAPAGSRMIVERRKTTVDSEAGENVAGLPAAPVVNSGAVACAEVTIIRMLARRAARRSAAAAAQTVGDTKG